MKKLVVYAFVLLFLLSRGEGLIAQNSPSDTSHTITPEKVSVFEDFTPKKTYPAGSSSSSPAVTHKVSIPAWILKCNPILLIRGEAPIYLEHKLNKSWSMEVAAGITFTDYLKAVVMQGKPLGQKDPNVNQLSGLTSKMAIRYFTGHQAGMGLYFSPEFGYVDYRKDVSGVYMASDGRYTNGKLMDEQRYYDIKTLVGWQSSDPYENDFTFDWYLGIGLRMGHEDNVMPDERNANVIKVNSSDVANPLICLGLKIGLGF
jgi:hypothetical protein